MRTVHFSEFGDPEVLQIHDVSKPIIQAGEVLVEVYAAGVNPSEVKNVQGAMAQTSLPRIPGRDFAGVVVEGPEELLGKEVWGTGGDIGFVRDGSHAQHLVIPQGSVQEKPVNLSFEEAASVGVSYVTAWSALVDVGSMTSSDVVAIVGANGSVGSAAVQLAKWQGAFVIGTVRSEAARHAVLQLGADEVVDTRHNDMHKAIFEITQGKGASLVFDTVGGTMFETSVRLLAQKGRLLEITATKERCVTFDLRDFYHREGRLFGVDSLQLHVTACSSILAKLKSGFEAGKLLPPHIAKTYPLEEAVQAYHAVAHGEAGGKVVLMMH